MKRLFLLLRPLLTPPALPAQDPGKSRWHVQAAGIAPNPYSGVPVANAPESGLSRSSYDWRLMAYDSTPTPLPCLLN